MAHVVSTSQSRTPSPYPLETVYGYAETHSARSYVASVRSVEECQEVLDFCRNNHLAICARGAGYTYGDMILNDGHLLLDVAGLNKIIEWNEYTGRIVVQPGVRFSEIFRIALPHRWTLGACPGGMGATVGGAIANNVHGKDSWKTGNFGSQVIEFKLLTADGSILGVSELCHPEVFHAVIGGMGVIGILVEATLQLQRVPSAYVVVSSRPARNVGELIGMVDEACHTADSCVAWVDAFATGSQTGRGYVVQAKWVETDERVDPHRLTRSLTMSTRLLDIFPAKPTWSALRPFFWPQTIRMANMAQYYHALMKTSASQTLLFTEYNFMHNRIPDWKHIYHPHGFLEFQPLIPRQCGVDAITELFRLCQRLGCQSLLCGLKPHTEDDFLLSYAGDGYSIGIDIQVRGRKPSDIEACANAIYDYTLACGGKVFLAKDELLPRHIFEQMYPHHQEFVRIKNTMDSGHLFMSDMYRRLMG